MWYVLQYKPNQGDRAQINLSNQGISCFYPKITVSRRKAGKRVEATEALFPGYMFIELSTGDSVWSKVRSTRGVLRVVGFAGKPAAVGEEVIRQIQEGVDAVSACVTFQPGQQVQVLGGPFKGLNAVFQSFDGEERALILISFMQQHCTVKIPSGLLDA